MNSELLDSMKHFLTLYPHVQLSCWSGAASLGLTYLSSFLAALHFAPAAVVSGMLAIVAV